MATSKTSITSTISSSAYSSSKSANASSKGLTITVCSISCNTVLIGKLEIVHIQRENRLAARNTGIQVVYTTGGQVIVEISVDFFTTYFRKKIACLSGCYPFRTNHPPIPALSRMAALLFPNAASSVARIKPTSEKSCRKNRGRPFMNNTLVAYFAMKS